MTAAHIAIPKPSLLSARLSNASILCYAFWLLLPAVQTTGGALAGVLCVVLFCLGVLLDSAYLKHCWFDFFLRALCILLLPLVLWFGLDRGGGNFLGFYCQQGMFWFPLLFCAYARDRGDPRLWRHLPTLMILCMALTTLTTIGWLIQGMLRGGRVYAYSRSLGNGEPGQEAYLKELMLRNIGGYDFIYATVLCLPLTCYAATRLRGWKRTGSVILVLTQLSMIALSQYLYALVFAIGLVAVELCAALARALSLRLFRRRLATASSLLWGFLPLIAVFLLRVPILSFAATLCEGIGFANFAYSLQQLLNALTGEAVDSASRLEYYLLPLQGIARSPFIGSLAGGAPLLSKHSDLLDLLSGVGILGAGLTACMMIRIGRGAFKGMKQNAAMPHLALQWTVLFACALLGTVVYSRDISLVFCAFTLPLLESTQL